MESSIKALILMMNFYVRIMEINIYLINTITNELEGMRGSLFPDNSLVFSVVDLG
jgi:hypothetical protein